MLLPEQIEEALSEGRLNFHEVQQIVKLFNIRALADECLMDNPKDKYSEKRIVSTSNEIVRILEKSKLSASERLTLAESKIEAKL